MSNDQMKGGLTRRAVLGGMAGMAAPSQTAVAATPNIPGVDTVASPAERVRYLSNELLQALAEMHPQHQWRSQIDHELCFAFFTRR